MVRRSPSLLAKRDARPLTSTGALQQARGVLVSAHGNCKKFFAPELPHSECASHAIDRLDIFCETITWQWEELGDHSHDVWPVSACPLPTRKNEAGSARTGHELNKAQSPLHKEL